MEEKIYFLWEYNWVPGALVKTNAKTYKIRVSLPGFAEHTRNVPKHKCAFPEEKVCIVWETQKGTNGRGSYRVERRLYPSIRVPARLVGRQCGSGRITE